jgi:D-glycero-D-manno-heptose 1,7-bisphosphate phosphatase
MKAAVFLERDGVLNDYVGDTERPTPPRRADQFVVRLDALPLLQRLKKAGYMLIATTNQPGVGKGEMSRSDLDMMHLLLRRRLPLDDILACPSDDATHPCCKPQPGMFLEAAFKWSLDLDRSFVISDKWQDAKAAHIAGCTSVMIQSPWIGRDHHDCVVGSLGEAVDRIERLQASLYGAATAVA